MDKCHLQPAELVISLSQLETDPWQSFEQGKHFQCLQYFKQRIVEYSLNSRVPNFLDQLQFLMNWIES